MITNDDHIVAQAHLDADEAGRAEPMAPAANEAAPLNPAMSSDLAQNAHDPRRPAVTADNLGIELNWSSARACSLRNDPP